jgi:hypothetical protein
LDEIQNAPSSSSLTTQTTPPSIVFAHDDTPSLHGSPRPPQNATLLFLLHLSSNGKHNVLEKRAERPKIAALFSSSRTFASERQAEGKRREIQITVTVKQNFIVRDLIDWMIKGFFYRL